jgi:hypothetical protein
MKKKQKRKFLIISLLAVLIISIGIYAFYKNSQQQKGFDRDLLSDYGRYEQRNEINKQTKILCGNISLRYLEAYNSYAVCDFDKNNDGVFQPYIAFYDNVSNKWILKEFTPEVYSFYEK